MKSVTKESQSVKRRLTAFLFVVLLIPFQTGYATDLTLPKDTAIQVYFSPDGGCTEAINKVLGRARQDILVQAYSFTSAPIAKALLDANRRGVTVQVNRASKLGNVRKMRRGVYGGVAAPETKPEEKTE
jgi:phosphatidylserine/phosphatidylglycerophosphate/cardiolipin synthase-like enzyme